MKKFGQSEQTIVPLHSKTEPLKFTFYEETTVCALRHSDVASWHGW